MMNDCKYNKIKLLHELSSIAWFIDKCGLQDAQESGDTKCVELFKSIRSELDTYIRHLEDSVKKC